ncbi:MAG: DUF1570 domain-containing protein [Planctomycetes bacterium]|nr:DUF1570 domain-containing protein [Planctomycetota bacterium]
MSWLWAIRCWRSAPLSLIGALAVAWLFVAMPARAIERLVITVDGREQDVAGRVLVETPEGSLLMQSADGRDWVIEPTQIVRREKDETPFVSLTAAELGKQLLTELPEGFETYSTQNYLICHNTSKAYAQWCGALFEQLYRAFSNYWTKRGVDLKKPEFPLVAIVFADKLSFASHARPELGDATDAIIGYYNFQTNRMTMYDLTGIEALRRPGARRTTSTQINEMLSLPEAERTVATIIHEATHQIAFNCGLQARYSDAPLWLSEGLAVFFETPDLKSSKGWSAIGSVNHVRLNLFRETLRGRPPDSLQTLIADDKRFRDPKQGQLAYAEAWSLHYYLSRVKPKQYIEYLKMESQKPPLVADTPEQRLQDFKQFFGAELPQLDNEFVRYMMKVH